MNTNKLAIVKMDRHLADESAEKIFCLFPEGTEVLAENHTWLFCADQVCYVITHPSFPEVADTERIPFLINSELVPQESLNITPLDLK